MLVHSRPVYASAVKSSCSPPNFATTVKDCVFSLFNKSLLVPDAHHVCASHCGTRRTESRLPPTDFVCWCVFCCFFFKGDCVTSAISRQIRAAVTAGPQRWRALKETGAAVVAAHKSSGGSSHAKMKMFMSCDSLKWPCPASARLVSVVSLEDNLLQVRRAGLCGGWDSAEWCLKML